MTCLYVYRLTDDSGFAPCVENDLLSLACCKEKTTIKKTKSLFFGAAYAPGSRLRVLRT